MQAVLALPVALAALFGTGFLANEWSHGAMSEAVGLGHHHVLDYGGYHCAGHGDAEHGAHHAAHMHGNASRPHQGCAGMHAGNDAGGMPGA